MSEEFKFDKCLPLLERPKAGNWADDSQRSSVANKSFFFGTVKAFSYALYSELFNMPRAMERELLYVLFCLPLWEVVNSALNQIPRVLFLAGGENTE